MKKINKISAGIITASLLAIQFVYPAHSILADTVKQEQMKKAHHQKDKNQAVKQDKAVWDKSSLSFISKCMDSDSVSAVIKNGEDSRAMQGEVTYEVFWSEAGNPKNGKVVATGVVKPLTSGETQTLTYPLDPLMAGNYMFKAYQRPNHPGAGELWSESLTVKENTDSNEQIQAQRPLDQFFNSSVNNGTATFTVPEAMGSVQISFSSYVYPDGIVPGEDGKPYEGQTIYDSITNNYGPGTHTIHVDLPENGYWQTDLYLGCSIETLTENGHPVDKIIDADYRSENE
ncbi:hypothetical protein FZC66_14500 [Priestia megaterium]|nr:hypothetical protein FZC66_14500 [Priestia megaterium]